MNRVNLVDENGVRTANWFDADAAECYKEHQVHDGKNWISTATGSQWNHEGLYITAKGKYVLNTWSYYQGSIDKYTLISKEDALEWLIKNQHYDVADEIEKGVLNTYEV